MIVYDYYRIFYFVAQYKSFTKAAEMLHNNQPNVTRCMNNLESELNCKLFIRSNRGVTLTPEGRKLYDHVSIAYEQLVAGEEEILQNRSFETGLVTIGTSETALHLVLADKLESFHEKYPNVRLHIQNHSTPQALAALENGLVDFATITSPFRTRGALHKIPLFSFREILIGGLKYADFASEVRNLHSLKSIPFISLGSGTGTRDLHIQYFLNHGIHFAPEMEVATTDQILPLIRHNLAIGFYPEQLAIRAIEQGQVVQIPIEESLPIRKVYLLIPENRPQSIAAKKLIHVLTDHGKQH